MLSRQRHDRNSFVGERFRILLSTYKLKAAWVVFLGMTEVKEEE